MASPVVYFVRRGHLPISRFLLFAIVTLWGCGSQAPAAVSSQQQSPERLSQLQLLARSPGVAIRLPAKGGTPQLYRLPRLTAVDGVLRGKFPPVERVVGLDPESEFLFVTTAKHELLAVDLGSGRVDTVAVAIAQAALGPDGTLYAVDTLRRVISLSRRTRFTWPQPLTALPRDLFGATDQHLVGVIPQDRLLIAAADQPPTVRPIATGGDVTASRWGDLVAVASDSGVTFYDPLGRWLLARPAVGDSAWIVDLPIKRHTGIVPTQWRADLPAISPDGMLIYRHGKDVVSARPDSLTDIGKVTNGAADIWILTTWLPRGIPASPVSTAAAESAGAGAEGPLYVQVSTSQNPEWSGHLADDLTRAGLAARVLAPQHPDDGYRVVLGPYATRAQAEATGRRLGRPFWIYQPSQ